MIGIIALLGFFLNLSIIFYVYKYISKKLNLIEITKNDKSLNKLKASDLKKYSDADIEYNTVEFLLKNSYNHIEHFNKCGKNSMIISFDDVKFKIIQEIISILRNDGFVCEYISENSDDIKITWK